MKFRAARWWVRLVLFYTLFSENELESFKCIEWNISFTIPKGQEACPRWLESTIVKIKGELAFSHSKPIWGIHIDNNNSSASTSPRPAYQRRHQAQRTLRITDRERQAAQKAKLEAREAWYKDNMARRRAERERIRAEKERRRTEKERIRAEKERLRAERQRIRAERERLRAQTRRLEELKSQPEESETIRRFSHTCAIRPICKISLKELNEISITSDYYHNEGGRMKPPTCTICYSAMSTKAIKLPCGHLFHKECTSMLLKNHTSCPLCRKPIL